MNDIREEGAPDPLDHLTKSQREELELGRHMARAVGLYLPLLITAIGTLVTAAWISRMPDPMAIHWGVTMLPDGYGPQWSAAAMALGLGLLLTALYALHALQIWQSEQRGGPVWSSAYRFVPAVVLGAVVMIESIAIGTASLQLDADDASKTGASGWVLLIAFALSILSAVAAFFIQPKIKIARPDVREADPLPLSLSERAVWVSRVGVARPAMWLLMGLVVLTGAATVWAFGVEMMVGWIMLFTFVVLLFAACSALWYRVRVDEKGLVATAALGWPVFRVKAEDVEGVQTLHVAPFAEFGGWGIRWAPGRFGIVLRTGEGILVKRRGKRDFVLTVDEAEIGAALLATAAEAAKRSANDQTDRD